jgi:hypothetical protein
MSCLRCGGMMVLEHFQEIRDHMGEGSDGWKCVSCGELLDPIILMNRSQAAPPLRHPRPPKGHRT